MKFINDESGATSIEYALIAIIVSLSIIVGMMSIRDSLNVKFNTLAQNLSTASR